MTHETELLQQILVELKKLSKLFNNMSTNGDKLQVEVIS